MGNMLTKNFGIVLVCISLVTGLIGCTIDPYTGKTIPSKAAVGVVAGAVIGAATSSKSDRTKGALIGAATGGGLGYYMDLQEKKLREQLQGTGVSVTREGNKIVLNMPGNLTFNKDSSDIQVSFFPTLNSLALVFKEFNKSDIKVSGHTDSDGDASYNQSLSERRANSVAYYLMSQSIPPERFHVVGYGESRPIADNGHPSGRAQNRRVEIELIPAKK
jgi:outer membrane protein OmpA-like peptidoglycan-associated protein